MEPIMYEGQPYYSTAQAISLSGFSRSYIAYLLRTRQVQGTRLMREWLISVPSFQAFLASPRKPGPKGPRNKGAKIVS